MVIDKLAHNKIKVTFFPYAMKVVTIRSLVTDNTKHCPVMHACEGRERRKRCMHAHNFEIKI